MEDLSIQGIPTVEGTNQEALVANKVEMEGLQDSLVLLPIGKKKQAKEMMDTTKESRSHMWK